MTARRYGRRFLGLGRFSAAVAVAVALAAGAPLLASAQASALATEAPAMLRPAPRLTFSAEEMALARAVAHDPGLAAFYGRNGLKPIFSGPAGAPRRAAALAAIGTAPQHGMPAARYRADALAAADPASLAGEVLLAETLARFASDLTGGFVDPAAADPQIHRRPRRVAVADMLAGFVAAPDPAAYLAGLASTDPRYLALQKALRVQAAPTVPPGTPRAPAGTWRIGARDSRLPDLRARLGAIGFPAAPAADPAVYDAALAAAVADYQRAAGLPDDGVAGPRTINRLNGGLEGQDRGILIALERMRWLGGENLADRHVWVNIPEFSARIIEDGHETFRTRVVVGKVEADQRTPEFSDEMEYVVVNPRWNVPRSITVKEYLPRLQANRNAVAHLDIVDGKGRVIDRGAIDFSRYTAANFPYRMRQKPSDDNALGIVKFIFPNPWNIYLHDTPTKHLFGQATRAYSHGCVRVGDPVDLAHALLSRQTSDPGGMFRRALNSGRETFLELKPHVPVHLVYFTAFPDETGTIRRFGDIYGRDARVWQAMTKAGLASGAESD